MPALDHTGGALIDGRICVGGGRRGGDIGWPAVPPTDCYDLETGTWSVEAPIPTPRGGSSYGVSCDGKLIVAGGEGTEEPYDIFQNEFRPFAWDVVEAFDGKSWSTMDSLNVGRHSTGLAVDCLCDTLTIASGSAVSFGGPEIRSVEMYFPLGYDTPCYRDDV